MCGPLTATILSVWAALTVLYLCLATKEPSFFLQIPIYGVLFVWMVFYLYEMQKKLNDKRIVKEKSIEDIHLTQEEYAKKLEWQKALEKKIDRFLNLHSFAETLKGIPEVREVAQKIVNEAHHLLPNADVCVLYLVNEANQQLSLVASSRRFEDAVKEKEGSIFDQWVMKRSRMIMIEDAMNDFRFSMEHREGTQELLSICASPLMTENKVLGVIRASASKVSAFSSDDLRLLDIISALGAVTLRNRLLYDRMEELAIRDSLTGLYLFRYFKEHLSEEILRTHLNKKSFSVILLDIDYFKKYNDEFGHSAGDIVLKNVASILLSNVSQADLVARYGGEEFVLLLPNKGKEEAAKLAERIRSEIEKSKIVLRRIEGSVTASIGVGTSPWAGRTADEIIHTVDKNLYKAKNLGRNRVYGD